MSKIRFIPYAVASFEIANVVLPERVAFHLPLPPRGWPMIVSQTHSENELMAFYARLPTNNPTDEDERRLREPIERYARAFGGRIKDDDDWHSYDAWLYFKHVSVEDLRMGHFDDGEKLQGKSRTLAKRSILTLPPRPPAASAWTSWMLREIPYRAIPSTIAAKSSAMPSTAP